MRRLRFFLIMGFGTATVVASAQLLFARPAPGDMVFIPSGEFMMGTAKAQVEELSKHVHPSLFGLEVPRRRVCAKAFYVDRYEVTNRQYLEFVRATGHRPPHYWLNKTYPQGHDDHPVIGVDWHDAAAYAGWAGKRLPTEEEWEKAARGTDGRLYPWGNSWVPGSCNLDDSSDGHIRFSTAPVGSFPQDRSPYDVMDMAGNVAEWTSTESTQNPGFYFVKGGSFIHSQPHNFRSAARAAQPSPNGMAGYIGFRCAMNAPVGAAHALAVEAVRRPNHPLTKPELPPPRWEMYQNCKIRLSSISEILPGQVEIKVPYFASTPGTDGPFFSENRFSILILENLGSANFDSRRFTYSPDHTQASYEWEEPGRLHVTVLLQGESDHVDIRYTFKNLSKRFMEQKISSCFNAMLSPNFADHEGSRTYVLTPRGFLPVSRLAREVKDRILLEQHSFRPVPRAQWASATDMEILSPFVVIQSRDGQGVISQASAEARTLFNNWEYSCQHSEIIAELTPGEEKTVLHKLYFLRGRPEDLLQRWREDFGNR